MAVVRALIMLGWCNGVGIGGVAASQLCRRRHGTARNGMRRASAPKPETGHTLRQDLRPLSSHSAARCRSALLAFALPAVAMHFADTEKAMHARTLARLRTHKCRQVGAAHPHSHGCAV